MKRWLILLAFYAVLGLAPSASAGELPAMTVWKNPSCGCCGNWVRHMEQAGFQVEVRNVDDLARVKRMAGIPGPLQSCHTASVGGYHIEGHVPASDVKRLLEMKADVDGLAVPGMPSGSPGMENGQYDAYDVVTFKRGQAPRVFKRYE